MVYARTLGSQSYTFQVSGMLWRNSLIMRDRETGSLWSHVTGEGLSGPAKSKRLERWTSVQTTWTKWRAAHPDTRVLKKSEEVLSSHYQKYFDDPERNGLFRSQWLMEKMPGKTKVHGAVVGAHAVAITDGAFGPDGLVSVDLGGTTAVVVLSSDGGVRAFEARVGDRKLEIEHAAGAFRDAATGSAWDLERGTATAGPMTGEALEPVPVTTVFWFAWSSFYPNTQVVE